MSDLLAFIRQLLPPQWRGPKTIGLVLILFGPILYIWDRISQVGADALRRAYANGQVGVLEQTLSTAINAPVYLLEGDRSALDFQVIVPPGTLPDDLRVLRDLLTRYALAGKRWRISEAPSYAPTGTDTRLAWSAGFPQRSATQLRWAVSRSGNFQTTLTKNGQVVFDEVRSYTANVEQTYPATVASDIYKLTVESLGFTMAGTGIIELWAVRNGVDNLSLLLDAGAGNAYTWVLETLNAQGAMVATTSGSFVYSPAGYPRPAISTALFGYGGLAAVTNGSFRLRVSGGVQGAVPTLLFESPFTISDAQPSVNFVLGPPTDNSGAIEAITLDAGEWAYVRASGPGANGGVEGRLTGPGGLDTGWRAMGAYTVTSGGQSFTHITNIKSLLAGVAGSFLFQARLTRNPQVAGSFPFVQGAPVTVNGPTMNLIRLRFRSPENLAEVGVTAPGNWEYQVARPNRYPAQYLDDPQQWMQYPPNWDAIAWTDFPGTGTGERVLSVPGRIGYTVLIRVRSKSKPSELYEVPIKCEGGSYGWLRLAEPTQGTVNRSAVSFLPYRTRREDLIVTVEPHTDPALVNLRIKSGYARATNTRWFWWVGTVPLFGRADQDDFLYPVAKGQLIEVYRYVTPVRALVNYDDAHPNNGQEWITTIQWTGSKYTNNNTLATDQVRVYIPA